RSHISVGCFAKTAGAACPGTGRARVPALCKWGRSGKFSRPGRRPGRLEAGSESAHSKATQVTILEHAMSLEQDLRPVQESSLGAYFRDRLLEHARQLRPPPHEDTCWYLGTLLERFSRSANLFANASGRPVLRPLALLYQDARDAPSEYQRCEILQ